MIVRSWPLPQGPKAATGPSVTGRPSAAPPRVEHRPPCRPRPPLSPESERYCPVLAGRCSPGPASYRAEGGVSVRTRIAVVLLPVLALVAGLSMPGAATAGSAPVFAARADLPERCAR